MLSAKSDINLMQIIYFHKRIFFSIPFFAKPQMIAFNFHLILRN